MAETSSMADTPWGDLNVPPLKTEEQLVAQLIKHRSEIRDGTALFNGVRINYETELTRFVRVAGFLHVRIRVYSGYHVVGQQPLDGLRRSYIIHSLILGWWSIPFGIVDTVRAVGTNMRGGIRSRVSDLIGGDDVVKLTKRAAEAAVKQMAERGFPPGSALRIDVTGRKSPRKYEITYDDSPPAGGRDWIIESNGVTILIFRKDAPRLKGLTVDFQQGAYTFHEGTFASSD
jgi:Fe-S cluster assembly iron-binding protein IscA